jgi:predicted phage tail component-like protein
VIYNGFDFSPWFKTKLITRSLLPEYEVETEDIPYRPGERFMRAKLKPLTITVRAEWRARPSDDMAALRRTMAARLVCLKEAPLVLDDERHLGLSYMAVLTSPGELDNLWHTGSAELEFTAYDPIAYGATKRGAVGYSTSLVVGGSYETRPVVTCKPGGSVSYIRLTNMDTGEYVQITAALTSSSTVVIDMAEEQVTINGANAAVTYESDYFALQPGRNSLRLSSGTGTIEWTERHIG